MEFKDELKKARQGYNMREATEIFNPPIPYRTWQQWESGERQPPEFVKTLVLEKLKNTISQK